MWVSYFVQRQKEMAEKRQKIFCGKNDGKCKNLEIVTFKTATKNVEVFI
jgi:hypothetical protein